MTKVTNQQQLIAYLRREWLIYVLAAGLFLAGGFLVLRQTWGMRYLLPWLVTAGALAGYLFGFLWKHLAENRPQGVTDGGVFPTLGLANGITITRAILIAALAGFVFLPPEHGWMAWAPGLLYLFAAIMDYLDGYAARITRRTSRLGEALDMQWDSIGVMVGALILVIYGQAPVFYLLVGVARYWFLFGLWVHRRRGLPVHDLPASRFRRPLAGVQMGYIAVALLPVFAPPFTWIAAVLFMLPHQVGFIHDYLSVTGRAKQSQARERSSNRAGQDLRETFILVVRALLVGLLVNLALYQAGHVVISIGVLIISSLAALALLLGVTGRIVALMLLLLAGASLQTAPLEWRYWFILFFSAILFFTGTGRFSLWKPEDWLIDHRAGEV